MVHFHYTSKERLTIKIVDDFGHSDTERIALFLEGFYNKDFNRKISFLIVTDLPKEQMGLLDNFCKRLPYESQIDLKYPLIVW